jgi:hypothetical protein
MCDTMVMTCHLTVEGIPRAGWVTWWVASEVDDQGVMLSDPQECASWRLPSAVSEYVGSVSALFLTSLDGTMRSAR